MFEVESKSQDDITIVTKSTKVTFDIAEATIDANLPVGKIEGPGEFEIGDVSIRGIALKAEEGVRPPVVYDVEIGGIHVGIVGGNENGLDDLGMPDILCTSSVKSIKDLQPKLVIAMGNVDGMVTELKMTARTEKKLKVKRMEDLPASPEVVVLN
ncbi:hypothetical protein IJH97_02785 [Candidatus Saccharibacteria bacterium]|nr:hypothetical protein [Candidatus Saccharibacteria bacterium]